MARFVKEAQLVRSGGPDFAQHGRIKRRAVSDDLIRVDAGGAQLLEKAFDRPSVAIAVDHLLADQPIAMRRRRVDREQEGQVALIDLIDTQDAGTCRHDPGLIIGQEVKASPIGAAALPNAGFTGAQPKIAGEALRHAAHGQPILLDGGDGRGDDPVGVAGIGSEEGRLGAEVLLAASAEMHAERDEKQNRMIESAVDGDALGGREAGGNLLAAITRESR